MKSAGDAGTSASEVQAVKLEAELIAAYGTEDTGGLLTNSVCELTALPSPVARSR